MNFKQYLEQNTIGKHNDFATASFLPSTWTGSEDLGKYGYGLPSTDLEVPNTTKCSIIKNIEKNKNPISVELSDGTKIYLSFDEYRRLKNLLSVGERLCVTFQRSPTDQSNNPSKIIKITN